MVLTTLRTAARNFLLQENGSAAKFEVIPLLLPLSAIGAPVIHPLLAIFYAFVLIPLLDLCTGEDNSAVPPGKISVETRLHFRNLLRYYCLVHYTMLLTVIHMVASPTSARPYSPLEILGLVLSLGVGASMSFTVAHELVHSTDGTDRALAAVLLLPNFSMHWGRSHLQHHAHVGTPRDPATSRKGEPIFAFWVRSVSGNLVNAFKAEWSLPKHGNVAIWIAAPLTLLFTTYAVYGWLGASVLLGQAIVSIIMLETVNYIEHYGLVRENKGAVLPKHSWNSSTSFGSAVSLNLQRHSDHHASAQKPYYLLESIQDAPQLPAGYPAMMLLSLIPPLWFRTMDPKLAAMQGEDVTSEHEERSRLKKD